MGGAESLSSDEKRAYELIASRDGLLQSRLWKELGADSRKGSRLAKSLEEKGLIERETTTHDGQRTYLLVAADDGASVAAPAPAPEPPTSPQDHADDPEADLTEQEAAALAFLRERNGMYQSEFWKGLDVSSRAGSRLATSLAERGLIRRVETTHDGQRTYFLQLTKRDLDFSLLMAGDLISPFVAVEDDIDPLRSEEFTHWILALAREER